MTPFFYENTRIPGYPVPAWWGSSCESGQEAGSPKSSLFQKNERFFKRLSKGPVYAGIWGTVLWGLPFFLLMSYFMNLEQDSGLLLLLFGLSLLGGFLFGYTMWYIIVKQVQKYLLEYTTDHMQTQSSPPSEVSTHQIHETSDNSDDKYSQLDKIAQLKKRGVLNKREFEKEKHNFKRKNGSCNKKEI